MFSWWFSYTDTIQSLFHSFHKQFWITLSMVIDVSLIRFKGCLHFYAANDPPFEILNGSSLLRYVLSLYQLNSFKCLVIHHNTIVFFIHIYIFFLLVFLCCCWIHLHGRRLGVSLLNWICLRPKWHDTHRHCAYCITFGKLHDKIAFHMMIHGFVGSCTWLRAGVWEFLCVRIVIRQSSLSFAS